MVIKTAVVETEVFGVKAWHARCLCQGCTFEGKRRGRHETALQDAKDHGRKHAENQGDRP